MKREDIKEGLIVYVRSNKDEDVIIQATVNNLIKRKRKLKDGRYSFCNIHLDKYVDENGEELTDDVIRYSLDYDISIAIDEVYATPMEVVDVIKAEHQARYDAIASEMKTLKELLEFPLKNGDSFGYEYGRSELVIQVYKDRAKELTGFILTDD